MQKAISLNISENWRKILINEKGAKLRRNIIIFYRVPKWMFLPQQNHLNHVELKKILIKTHFIRMHVVEI